MRIIKSNNDSVDFCIGCFPEEIDAHHEFGDVGNGPDNRGNCYIYDADHPLYEDTDYVCFYCKESLIDLDNSFLN